MLHIFGLKFLAVQDYAKVCHEAASSRSGRKAGKGSSSALSWRHIVIAARWIALMLTIAVDVPCRGLHLHDLVLTALEASSLSSVKVPITARIRC